jgi:hypothetical protein
MIAHRADVTVLSGVDVERCAQVAPFSIDSSMTMLTRLTLTNEPDEPCCPRRQSASAFHRTRSHAGQKIALGD